MPYQDIYSLVGNTPLLKLSPIGLCDASIYVKMEGYNPTGSVKDRACIKLIRNVLERGDLKPGMTLLDASSGNLGCALAFYARLMRFETLIVCSSKLTQAKLEFMRYYGARVLQIGDFTIEGNRYCRQLTEGEPHRFCFLDQLHSWSNPQCHYETTGPEIIDALPNVAMIVASLGSGGTVMGIGKFLKEYYPHVLIGAVQAEIGSRIPGTASLDEGDYVTPFIERAYAESVIDLTFKVSESEAFSGAMELRDQGVFAGLQTGGVFFAARQFIRQRNLKGNVVILSGDSGWKNLDKLFRAEPGKPCPFPESV